MYLLYASFLYKYMVKVCTAWVLKVVQVNCVSLLQSSWFFLCWFNICLVQVYAWEMGLEANPTLVVVVVEERRLQSPMADSRDQGWFKHESHCTCEFRRSHCIYSSNCRLQNSYKNASDMNCISHSGVRFRYDLEENEIKCVVAAAQNRFIPRMW